MKKFLLFLLVISLFSVGRAFSQTVYYWTNANGTGVWSDPLNWDDGFGAQSVPDAALSDEAYFIDDASSSSCSIDVATGAIVRITLDANYSGTLTQGGVVVNPLAMDVNGGTYVGSGSSMSVGGALTISGGTFTKGSGTLQVNGLMTVSGGAFSSTAGNMAMNGGLLVSLGSFVVSSTGNTDVRSSFNFSGGTFTHSAGTFRFQDSNMTISGTPSFNNVTFINSNSALYTFTIVSSITVNGNLIMASGAFTAASRAIVLNSGTINLSGNLTVSGNTTSTDGGGSTTIVLNNTVSSQTISGSTGVATAAGRWAFPNITINKSSAALVLSNVISVKGNFNYIGSGAITNTNNTLAFVGDAQTINPIPSFNNLIIGGTDTKTFAANTAVTGTLTISAATLDVGVNTLNGAGALTMSGGTLRLAKTGTTLPELSGTYTLSGGAIEFAGEGAQTIRNLSYQGITFSGAGVKTPPTTLNVAGAFTDNSGFFDNNSGTVVFNGSSSQTISGSANTIFHHLTASQSVNVESDISIENTLTLSGTVTFDADGSGVGSTTLLSSASATARVAEIPAGASVTGSVTVQTHFTNGNSTRRYRYFSSPVTNSNVADWQNEIPVTGTFDDPSAGEGIISENPSMFLYDEQLVAGIDDRWVAYPSSGTAASNALLQGRGYGLYVRSTSSVTLDTRGTIGQGTVNINLTAQSGGGDDGWNLTGNPYPSPIDWDNVEASDRPSMNNAIYIKDNTSVGSQAAGTFISYVDGVSTSGEAFTGEIAAGQAFWVKANGNTTLTLRESHKTSSSATFYRVSNKPIAQSQSLIRITAEGNDRKDALVIRFKDGATKQLDEELDALKYSNDFINFSSHNGAEKYAINTLPNFDCTDSVGLSIDRFSNGTYTFNFETLENIDNAYTITLYDAFADSLILVAPQTTYSFEVSSNGTSKGANRFKLYLTKPTVGSEVQASLVKPEICISENLQIAIANSQSGVYYYFLASGDTLGSPIMGNGDEVLFNIPATHLGLGLTTLDLYASNSSCNAIAIPEMLSVEVIDVPTFAGSFDVITCLNQQVELQVSSPEASSYRWYTSQNSLTPLIENASGKLSIQSLTVSKTYYVSVVNVVGCESNRIPVRAIINEENNIPVQSALNVCADQDFDIELSNAPNAKEYRLYNAANAANPILVSSSASFPINGLSNSMNYYVTAVNESDCEGAKTLLAINVESLPEVISSNYSVCQGGTASIILSSSGDPVNYAIYESLEATEPIGITEENSWTTSELTQNRQYFISARNNLGCEGERTLIDIQVESVDQPVVTAISEQCEGNEAFVEMETLSPGDYYAWFLIGENEPFVITDANVLFTEHLDQTANYYVKRISASGCESVALEVVVNVDLIPELSSVSAPSETCFGQDVIITANASPSAVEYRWFDSENNLIKSGSESSLVISSIQQNASYSVVAVNSLGCAGNKFDFEILVNPSPAQPMVEGASSCNSAALVLKASGANNGELYRWYDSMEGGNLLLESENSEFTSPEISQSTTYYASIVSTKGCESTRSAVIANIIEILPAEINVLDNNVFQSNYTEGNQWFFNGESIEGATNNTFVPTESGVYTLQVTSDGGCVSSIDIEWRVLGLPQHLYGLIVAYPNPASSKINIKSDQLVLESVVVYDLTGSKINVVFDRIDNHHGSVSLDDLAKGIYVIQISTDEGLVNKRFIKK